MGQPRHPPRESALAQISSGGPADAFTGVKSPPVVEVAGEDYYRKEIVHTPPTVRAPPRTA